MLGRTQILAISIKKKQKVLKSSWKFGPTVIQIINLTNQAQINLKSQTISLKIAFKKHFRNKNQPSNQFSFQTFTPSIEKFTMN